MYGNDKDDIKKGTTNVDARTEADQCGNLQVTLVDFQAVQIVSSDETRVHLLEPE